MEQAFFITGTDTDVGKTWATLVLMHYFKNRGKTVIGMKPVAAGCVWQDGQWKNQDALLMQAHSNVEVSYALINRYAYEQPLSPHLAGAANPMQIEPVLADFAQLADQAQIVLVEGAGGWYSPLNDTLDNCRLAQALGLPVILVVGLRLGCINHARLTYEAIKNSGLGCVGWLAMTVGPEMQQIDRNIETLRKSLDTALLGVIPFNSVGCFKEWADFISI